MRTYYVCKKNPETCSSLLFSNVKKARILLRNHYENICPDDGFIEVRLVYIRTYMPLGVNVVYTQKDL